MHEQASKTRYINLIFTHLTICYLELIQAKLTQSSSFLSYEFHVQIKGCAKLK